MRTPLLTPRLPLVWLAAALLGISAAGCGEKSPSDPEAECGNAVLETGEQCDDGNTTDGDGCDSTCNVESGWDCGEDGTARKRIMYGQGTVNGDEQRDDGNTTDGDGCDSTCNVKPSWDCCQDGTSRTRIVAGWGP